MGKGVEEGREGGRAWDGEEIGGGRGRERGGAEGNREGEGRGGSGGGCGWVDRWRREEGRGMVRQEGREVEDRVALVRWIGGWVGEDRVALVRWKGGGVGECGQHGGGGWGGRICCEPDFIGLTFSRMLLRMLSFPHAFLSRI